MGFPSDWDGKESACNVRDVGSSPELGRSPREGNGSPFQYYCLENFMDRGAWRAIVHRVSKTQHDWTTEHPQALHIPHATWASASVWRFSLAQSSFSCSVQVCENRFFSCPSLSFPIPDTVSCSLFRKKTNSFRNVMSERGAFKIIFNLSPVSVSSWVIPKEFSPSANKAALNLT